MRRASNVHQSVCRYLTPNETVAMVSPTRRHARITRAATWPALRPVCPVFTDNSTDSD